MSLQNPNVEKIMKAIRENFSSIGYTVKDAPTESVIHLPHLVSAPGFDRDEQREQVQMLTEISLNTAQVVGAIFTLRDTEGCEGRKDWHHFYVEIHIPK